MQFINVSYYIIALEINDLDLGTLLTDTYKNNSLLSGKI